MGRRQLEKSSRGIGDGEEQQGDRKMWKELAGGRREEEEG